MTTIYILELEGGNYYIGKTGNVVARYQQHLAGKGSAWTKLHRPVSLVRTIEGASPFEEDKITKEYMAKYGIEKVRGGSYVETELSPFHMDALNMEIRGAKNLCTRCGRGGHFIKDCYATTDISGAEFESDSDDYDDSDDDYDYDSDDIDEPLTMKEQLALRALEMQLKKSSITSSAVIQPIMKSVQMPQIQRGYTTSVSYGSISSGSSYITIGGKTTSFHSKLTGVCYRCGRAGHYASDCYAKTRVGRK